MLYTLNRGMGFVVSRRLQLYLQTYTISKRVAVISFRFSKFDPPVSVIIVYGPTFSRCTSDLQLNQDFYQQLQAAVDSRYFGLGAWSKGRRNDNGETFLNSWEQSNLIITNSLVKHPSRHIKTWQRYIRGLDGD